MHEQDIAAWGKTLLEEIVLQAALQWKDADAAPQAADFAMPFHITADTAARQLVLRCKRIGAEDLSLRIDIPTQGDG